MLILFYRLKIACRNIQLHGFFVLCVKIIQVFIFCFIFWMRTRERFWNEYTLYLYAWRGCDVVCHAIKFSKCYTWCVCAVIDLHSNQYCISIQRFRLYFGILFLCQIVEIDWALTYDAYFTLCICITSEMSKVQHIVIFVIKSQMISWGPFFASKYSESRKSRKCRHCKIHFSWMRSAVAVKKS